MRSQRELAEIESSLAWRLFGRFGPPVNGTDAAQRLREVHASAAYRLIASVKGSRPYRVLKKRGA